MSSFVNAVEWTSGRPNRGAGWWAPEVRRQSVPRAPVLPVFPVGLGTQEHNERVSNDNSFKDRMSRKEEGVASQRQAIEMATTVAALASSKRKRSRK
eukprot:6172340-Pyramimonas_sp.AAC.1